MSTIDFRGESNIREGLGITPVLGERVMIDPSAVVMGDVTLGDDVSVWPHAAMRGDVQVIRIGARTNIQDATVVHVSGRGSPTVIGDEVTIGHHCLIHACTLQHRCFIGMRATVMDDAVVETGAMVAAGALVTPGKTLEGGWLWAGQAASRGNSRFEYCNAWQSACVRWWAAA